MKIENRMVGDRVAAAKREIRKRSHDGIERRTVPSRIELRADDDAGPGEFVGHAAVFDDLSEDLGFFESWYERIDPKAFDAVLRKGPDVRALFNHDPNFPLARTGLDADAPGGLVLVADEVGLEYRFTPTDTSYARDLRENVRAGVVSQSSFAFRVARKGDSWEEDDEGRLVRTIHQFSELYDVSPVTYPAYPTTDVGLASHDLVADGDEDRNFGGGEDAPEGDDPDTPETCTGADGCPGCDNPAQCPHERSGGEHDDTAPDGERHDDEPAEQRVGDGPTRDTAADEPHDDEQGAWRLALARRRMGLRELMGDKPA